MTDYLGVVIRCKPSTEEKAWKIDTNRLLPGNETDSGVPSKSYFSYDHIFTENSAHSEVYQKTVKPLLENLLLCDSSNVCVFTYGLTCSGKSHTIFGTSGQARIREEARGIIHRCGQQLFDELQNNRTYANSNCRISVTFCHVFDDGRVADLFDTKKRNLEIVDSSSSFCCFVPGLTEQVVTSSQDVLRLVEKGYLMRNATGCLKELPKKLTLISHAQPLQQYRPHCSHAVFTFKIEHLRRGENEVYTSQISLVDLSGQGIEQLHSDTSNHNFDSGIDVLHKVLATSSEKGFSAASSLHSKSSLTKLLKHSLGGNCQTLFIGNICLSESSAPLTRKCLEVLSAAKATKNFTKVVPVPLLQTKLGMCMEEAQSKKAAIVQKLQANADEGGNLEIASEQSCIINGTLYDDLSTSTQDLLKKLAAVESQLVSSGKPIQKRPHSAKVKQPHLPGHPLAMVRPLSLDKNKSTMPKTSIKLASTKGSTTVEGIPKSQNTPASVNNTQLETGNPHPQNESNQRQSAKESENLSNESTSSLEETDSNSEEDPVPTTPVVAGPLPPPLKDIPHIKPDSPVASQVFPYAAGDGSTTSKRPLSASTPVHVSVLPQPIRQPTLQFPAKPHTMQDPQVLAKPFQPVSINKQPISQVSNSVGRQNSPSTPTPIMIPVQTSTPKAKRSLFPELTSPGKAPSFGETTTGKQSENTNLEGREHHAAELVTKQAKQMGSILKTTLVPAPTLGKDEPPKRLTPLKEAISHGSRKPPSGSAGRKNGYRSRRRHRQPPVSSTEEESSSSEDLSSDSDTELSDEARDVFDPRMQQRRLPLQPMPLMPSSMAHAYGGSSIAQRAVLPPITSTASLSQNNHSRTLPPLQGPGTPAHHFAMAERYPMSHSALHQLKPLENPPAYQEASGRYTSTDAYGNRNANLQRRSVDGYSQGSAVLDTSLNDPLHYMSQEEIHTSAMEGVRSSQMKDLALQYGVDYRDHGGRTPLMYAVLGNQPKMCEVLLKLKASINAKDATGYTPLLWATYQAKPDVMKVLLRNQNVDIKCCDKDGRNIYHWAMKTPNIRCLKWLCKYVNSPYLVNQLDKEGLTPLHWAVMSDQASHIRLLLISTSADVSIQDKEGRSPLNYAVLNYSPSCIRAILDHCESAVNLIDSKGRTALHYACAEGRADCVRTLLSYHSCNLHCTDAKDTTPLHWAAAANQAGLVQILLRRGADRSQRDSSDKTPADYAQERGHTECVKILQTYGLRRPMSAISLASHSSLHGASLATPTLDEHGHVQLKRPKRKFSLSGESVTSFDRQPADGQAQEGSSEVHQSVGVDYSEKNKGEQMNHNCAEGTASSVVFNEQWAESRHTEQLQESPIYQGTTGSSSRPRLLSLRVLCGRCFGQRNNAVAPVN